MILCFSALANYLLEKIGLLKKINGSRVWQVTGKSCEVLPDVLMQETGECQEQGANEGGFRHFTIY